MDFNPQPSNIMHIDLNSCFASVEQQANPLLRGKPIAVAAYNSPNGCILAPSIEAKRFGIKTGMRVKEGKLLYSKLIILTSDPDKYRFIHLKLRDLLNDYSANVTPKSIDEFVIEMDCPKNFAPEIKKRIKEEIGDWLRVSIGVAPNRFLAKTAAGLHKPDGLDEINKDNFLEIFSKLKLMDLCGIKQNNCVRLNNEGIFTVMDFFNASAEKLQRAFHSVVGHDWYLRLHGWEADNVVFGRRSYGNSFALPKSFVHPEELAPILQKLVEKTGIRMRMAGFNCQGVHVSLLYRDGSYWHHGEKTGGLLFDSRDIYKTAFEIMCRSPYRKPVAILAESCFNLEKTRICQESLFEDLEKKRKLVLALDTINHKWGEFVITPALMMNTDNLVSDRIAFGGIKELEELTVAKAGVEPA